MTAPKPEAVIDASVWIALSVVGCLDLLSLFFARVYLPDAVYAEILRGEHRFGHSELQQANNIRAQCPLPMRFRPR